MSMKAAAEFFSEYENFKFFSSKLLFFSEQENKKKFKTALFRSRERKNLINENW